MSHPTPPLGRKLLKKIFETQGLMELYVNFCDLSMSPPVYDSGWRHLPGWIKDLSRCSPAASDLSGQRVLFFSDLPYWVDYSLALAVLILSRGAYVDFAWLSHPTYANQLPCTIAYPFWERSSKVLAKKTFHPRFRLLDLIQTPMAAVTPIMLDIANKQAIVDTSYVLLKECVNINSNPEDKEEYEFRLTRNLDAMRRLATLCQENKYDRVILPNGAILEFGAVNNLLVKMGIPISTFETQNNGTIVVSNKDNVMGMCMDDLWEKDIPHELSTERAERIERFIKTRQKPISNHVNTNSLQLAEVVSADNIRRQLGIIQGKPVVLVCPNCAFDAAYLMEGARHFSTMTEWLIKTTEYLIKRNDCQVIIRSHPAEAYYKTADTTEKIISESFPKLPDHIKLIRPEDIISTYSIMKIVDLGLIYWSTTGMEMAIRGIPVVCGVPTVHYNRKGFTLDPKSVKEYFEMIDAVIKSPAVSRLTVRQIELSKCYVDLFFNDWPKPFPWSLGRQFWKDLKEWPISRMMSPEGEAKFGGTLRALGGL